MNVLSRSFIPFKQRYSLALVACLLLLAPVCRAGDSVYDFSLVKIDGRIVSLSTYKGQVLLIVNLGRNSTFSDQLASLDKVYDSYKDKGLIVIGVPSNDFGAGEPGTDGEVKKAYADLHPVFPIMARVSVRGKDQAPLFGYLTSAKDKSLGGDVHWNFTKFIVDRNGQVVARFAPDVDPESPQLKLIIEKVLAGTLKKPDKGEEEDASQKTDDDDDSEP